MIGMPVNEEVATVDDGQEDKAARKLVTRLAMALILMVCGSYAVLHFAGHH